MQTATTFAAQPPTEPPGTAQKAHSERATFLCYTTPPNSRKISELERTQWFQGKWVAQHEF